MSAEKIIADWKKKSFKPVYWLEGDENYFIDKVTAYAEHHLLPEAERGFNLSVFYGRDADWAQIVNACMRYPMFGDRQVVVLKEAQHLKEIDKLEHYIEHPLASTIFVVAYKEKKIDGRTKLAKILKTKTELLTTKKLYDNQLPSWVTEMVQSRGYTAKTKAVMLLVDHVGNDLSRLENEVEKLVINLGDRGEITEDDIEKYIGISKEYNVFELQDAMARRDLPKAMKIIQYFENNPKAGPIQMILPSLYNFFSKTFMVFGVAQKDEKLVASAIGVNPFFAKDYLKAASTYQYEGVEKTILLLHHYNLLSIG
ncbi:MAG: DNA polymerase III subunit delta, partial [Dinghuibacter sp.]|nr:DNA polymerase III subunit delta [Dinghuibacter sp.]